MGGRLLSVAAVAGRLGVSAGTVRTLIKQRKLPLTEVGSSWRVKEEEVEAYLAVNTSGPQRTQSRVKVDAAREKEARHRRIEERLRQRPEFAARFSDR